MHRTFRLTFSSLHQCFTAAKCHLKRIKIVLQQTKYQDYDYFDNKLLQKQTSKQKKKMVLKSL